MKSNTKALTASAYLSMLFLGIASTMIGAAARNIGLTPFQIGLFLTIQNVGFMIGVSVAGAGTVTAALLLTVVPVAAPRTMPVAV